MQRQAAFGGIGILLACALWIGSVAALARAMAHSAQSSSTLSAYHAHARVGGSPGLPMALWCAAFTLLQLASWLLLVFVLRAAWRLRTAICFSLAFLLLFAADVAGLFALLVYLRVTLGTN